MYCHEIDYEIFGDDIQIVEVELDPGESVIAEAGAMNLQSLPFSRLAERVLRSASGLGQSKGEGSVLGQLGDLFGDH